MLPREGDGYCADVEVGGRKLRLGSYMMLTQCKGWAAEVYDRESKQRIAGPQPVNEPEEGKNKAVELARTAINAELPGNLEWKEDPPGWNTRRS